MAMNRYGWVLAAVVVACVAVLPPAQAEITSIAGFAQARVTEYRLGDQGDSDLATESFPGTAAELPIQVVAQLLSSDFAASNDPNHLAAAAVAAQFADPRDLDQLNPEEFAINLALSSNSSTISYEAEALSRETRGVVFSAAELGIFGASGAPVNLAGTLFVDGALTLFAIDTAKDLSEAFVELSVTVVQRVEGLDDRTVYSGSVELAGTATGGSLVEVEGAFPTRQLLLVDLGSLVGDYAAFHILVIPDIAINFTYAAVADEPFTLEATVEVAAANVPGESGVAAVIGTPSDTLSQVIGFTQGTSVASSAITAIEEERDDPTGTLVFSGLSALLPSCGLFGFEFVLGTAGLAGLVGFANVRTGRRR
jgi:hypothetical protein